MSSATPRSEAPPKAAPRRALPKVISVDDHVVEPAHVWQTWLPTHYRARGPRIERKRWGDFKLTPGARAVECIGADRVSVG